MGKVGQDWFPEPASDPRDEIRRSLPSGRYPDRRTKGITDRSCDPADHPALRAWRNLSPGCAIPKKVDLLAAKKGKRRYVYRLVGSGPGGSDLIVKRCVREAALVERVVYSEILPSIPVPSLSLYGFLDTPDPKLSWLFLEDAGGTHYSPYFVEDTTLAAAWLGTVHAFAAEHPMLAQLPDRRLGFYLSELRSIRTAILDFSGDLAPKTDERATLKAIRSQCDFLESRWQSLERACEGIPNTLVHWDLGPHNIIIRQTPAGPAVLPFDWGQSACGVPLPDLDSIHLPTYLATVREHWPGLNETGLVRLMNLGKVFRYLAKMEWVSRDLYTRPLPDWVLQLLGRYRISMDNAIEKSGLRSGLGKMLLAIGLNAFMPVSEMPVFPLE